MRYPLVLDLAADGIPVAVTCRVLGFSKQAFYAWKKDPVCQRDWDEAHLINAAADIHADDPAFGYRFIADELPARGITAGENKVARLCSQQQIRSVFAERRGLGRKAGPPVHDDLVARQFTADSPDRVWLTDITEHPTAEGKLYLCAIKDVWSNRIVGYSIDSRMKSRLAVAALENALARRRAEGAEVAGCVLHTDRGSQGGFNWSSQHLDPGGVDGQASRVDGGAYRAVADEVTGGAVASAGGRARVLA
jgi:putative transposase